jgi:BatD DUF11 like domain
MHRSLLLFIFLLLQSIGFAQTKFYATVSATEIGREDYLQLKLIIENASKVDKISNPMLTKFTIESGPNEETGVSIINGKTKKYLALNYIIKPKAVGTFTIPAVIAIADGKEYKSESITIKVLEKGTVNTQSQQSVYDTYDTRQENQINIAEYTVKENENIDDKVKGKMFVKAIVDKKQVYVGEPIGVTYKLYTRLKSESNVVKNPSFNGFSVVEMELSSPVQYSIEKLNGKEFNVYVLRKAQLYPLQDGQLNIEKIEVENIVTFIKENYLKKRQDDFFDDFGQIPLPPEAFVNQKINIESEVIPINVKPLPSKKIPLLFKGAVGNFSINAKLKEDEVFTNTTNQLIVTITGKGNLHLINTPDIKWPRGFENFEAIVTDDLDKTIIPISGSKTFVIPFVVSDTGKYLLDSINFSFFDSKIGQYKKVFTKPMALLVKKGAGKNVGIKDNIDSSKKWLDKFNTNRKWVIALLAAIITIGTFIWLKKDKNQQAIANANIDSVNEVSNEEGNVTVKKDWLQNTKEVLLTEDETIFYKTIHTELVAFLSYKFNIDTALINKQTIFKVMEQSNIDFGIIEKVIATLRLLDDKLYNPYSSHETTLQITDIYDNVQNSIEKLS